MKTTLLILLFLCHYLADFTWLSTNWMLAAKRFGKPIIPIMAHAGVHGILMGIVIYFYLPLNQPMFWNLLVFQIWTHLLIDIWKGRMNGWFPILQNPNKKLHWVVFGLDQFLHAVVIIFMVHYISQ